MFALQSKAPNQPSHNKIPEDGDIGCKKVEVVDEIQRFLDARYVSASEAVWRIFQFRLQHVFPSVVPLPVHLPSRQPVIFDETETEEATRTRLRKAEPLICLNFFVSIREKNALLYQPRSASYQSLGEYALQVVRCFSPNFQSILHGKLVTVIVTGNVE